MDLDLDFLRRGFDLSRRKKKWIVLLGALGFSGYGAYRVFNSPSIVKKREGLSKLIGSVFAMAAMVSDSAEAIGIVSKDVKEFLQSDSDEIPNSLKQICKLTRSDEMSESLARITTALTVGVLRGSRQERMNAGGKKPDFSDRVLDKLFTEAGAGFASVIIGSFSKNVVLAYYSSELRNDSANSGSSVHWGDLILEDKFRELIGDCVRMFVSTAVSVYLDKTMHINTYDELFSGMTNPKHEAQVKDMLSSICNGAVETLVRSSHQVLADRGGAKNPPRIISLGSLKPGSSDGSGGWMRKMCSTLVMPKNKRFVLDVTGRITFETVRSFLEFLVEKIFEGMKRSADAVQEEVVERGIEVVQHAGRTSSAVVSICLSLCVHILNGPWILVPN